MKFGIHLQVAAKRWLELTKAAEEAGLESVWLPDHLIMPVEMGGDDELNDAWKGLSASTPVWDPWVQLGWLAAQTSTIRFGTNVFNIGLRHPFVTARAVTTADLVSNGRVEFGVGASWLAEEWDALELPFETRGRRVDESIEVIRRLFSEDTIEHEGEFFRFRAVGFLPKPVNGSVRFHIGGDSRAAIRRAARFGDGWIPPAQPDMQTLSRKLANIHRLRTELSRSGPFEVTVCGLTSPSLDDVRRYQEAGVERLIMVPWTNPREGADVLRRFGDEVIQKL